LKYGQKKDEVYGVLFDGAWLWEEYLGIILKEDFIHYYKSKGKRWRLFDTGQQIIPDYISKDMSIVADAKYIPLNKQAEYGEEKATAVYYKTITYMYRFCTDIAYLLYPIPSNNQDPKEKNLYITSEREGVNGGRIIKEGLRIPQECNSFDEFTNAMQQSEDQFIKSITPNS
jgi:5-methylcytosine-specific restriction endonuclease McrBC regulatory subunit McrC